MANSYEKVSLMSNGINDSSQLNSKLSDAPDTNSSDLQGEINLNEATVMFVALGFGTSVLILPYTVSQLGPVSWILSLQIIVFLTGYCTYLLNESCIKYLENKSKRVTIYQSLYIEMAKDSVGVIFSNAVSITLQVNYISICVAYFLLSSSILQSMISIEGLSVNNEIRIWSCLLLVLTSPLMYIGIYKDLKTTSVFAFISISLATIILMAICLVAKFKYNFNSEVFFHKYPTPKDNIFITFGTVLFTFGGPALIVCNVIVFVREQKKLAYSICGSFALLYIIYVAVGLIPYIVFGDSLKPSLTNTIDEIKGTNAPFKIFVIISQVLLLLHMLFAAVMIANPMFNNIESYFQIPAVLSWKRVAVRTVVLLLLLAICLAIPNFEPIISVVGAVPLMLVAAIYPMVIYAHTFQLGVANKALLVILWLFSVILMVGNFIYNIKSIVQTGGK